MNNLFFYNMFIEQIWFEREGGGWVEILKSQIVYRVINAFLAGLHEVHPAYIKVNATQVGGWGPLIGYLLCVINSSHTF
jgi:hypothetical protein